MAKPLKAVDIQRDVVVYEEDRSGSMHFRIADVSDYAVKRISVKIATTHFDDGAETTVIRAPA